MGGTVRPARGRRGGDRGPESGQGLSWAEGDYQQRQPSEHRVGVGGRHRGDLARLVWEPGGDTVPRPRPSSRERGRQGMLLSRSAQP